MVLAFLLFYVYTRPQDAEKCGKRFVGRYHTVFEISSTEFEYVAESICVTLEMHVFCKRIRYQCSFVSAHQTKSACQPWPILFKCSFSDGRHAVHKNNTGWPSSWAHTSGLNFVPSCALKALRQILTIWDPNLTWKHVHCPCPCGNGDQTIDHVLYQCTILNKQREIFTRNVIKSGKWPARKQEIISRHLKSFLLFLNSINFDLL
jgi:hypothetical protein